MSQVNLAELARNPEYRTDAYWIIKFGFGYLPPHYDDPRYYCEEQREFIVHLCANWRGIEEGLALWHEYYRGKNEIASATEDELVALEKIRSDKSIRLAASKSGRPVEQIRKREIENWKRRELEKHRKAYGDIIPDTVKADVISERKKSDKSGSQQSAERYADMRQKMKEASKAIDLFAAIEENTAEDGDSKA